MTGRPGMRRPGHVPSGGPGGYTARMNLRAASVLLVLVLAAVLSGCGNKGPLVLPDAPAADADAAVAPPPAADAAATPSPPADDAAKAPPR